MLKKQNTNCHAIFLFEKESSVFVFTVVSCIEVEVGIIAIGIEVVAVVAAAVMIEEIEAIEGIVNENGGMRSSKYLFFHYFIVFGMNLDVKCIRMGVSSFRRKCSDHTERKERKPEEKSQKRVESAPVQNTEKKEESAPTVKSEEYEIEEGEDVSANMAQIMGFSSFGSTKAMQRDRCKD